MLRQLGGGAEFLRRRPAISLALGLAFLALGGLFATGRLPDETRGTVTQGEAIVMATSCLVVAAYFLSSAWLGLRHRRSSRS